MPNKEKSIAWFRVYNEIANRLMFFYVAFDDNAGHELYKQLNASSIYRKHNSWLSNITRLNKPTIEPIQLFTSFSRSGQNEKVRIEIIKEVLKIVDAPRPTWTIIDFEGCPTPVALKLQYVRPAEVQIEIWDSFARIMKLGKKGLTETLWQKAKNWRGIQIPAFTIFLFWIKSSKFLPLDKNTRKLLIMQKFINDDKNLSFYSYMNLINNYKIKNYPNIALMAYYYNNSYEKYEKLLSRYTVGLKEKKVDTQFRVIGFRTLKRNSTVHKILKPFNYYSIDQAIVPSVIKNKAQTILTEFETKETKAESIYNLKNLKVNISAIVGKNGSGKSTILDILLMSIYNLSLKLGYLDQEKKKLPLLNFELYWHSDTLYKLVFEKEIRFFRFNKKTTSGQSIQYKLNESEISIRSLPVKFFYSILVNFSHYALNSNDYATDWVSPLSHKNDGYLTPVVINPKRTNGNININNERELLNMRLLQNFLELHDDDIEERSFRQIDNQKQIKYFSLHFNKTKTKNIFIEVQKQTYEDPKINEYILEKTASVFGISPRKTKDVYNYAAIENYIVYKFFSIAKQYEKYKNKYHAGLENLVERNIASTVEGMDTEFEFHLKQLLEEILTDFRNDTSHVTVKFKQAVNYLKFSVLNKEIQKSIENKQAIELGRYNQLINNVINDNPAEKLEVETLLPPPVYSLDFHFDDNDKSSFSRASSGEYQLLSVLSTILYHFRNIDSVIDNNYSQVMVLLDEIELYFHPNMQRYFIKKLLDALAKMDTEIEGVHILFSTHSPFILSDIQQQKILKLNKGDIAEMDNGKNSFAANIHDLLSDEFFLDESYMGAFAKKQIEIIINLLNCAILDKNLAEPADKILKGKEKEKYLKQLSAIGYNNEYGPLDKWKFEEHSQTILEVIESIGEPVIKQRMYDMYTSVVPASEVDERQAAKNQIYQLMREHNIKHKDLE